MKYDTISISFSWSNFNTLTRGNPYATGKTFTPELFIRDTRVAGAEGEVHSTAKTMTVVLEGPHLLVLPCLQLTAKS